MLVVINHLTMHKTSAFVSSSIFKNRSSPMYSHLISIRSISKAAISSKISKLMNSANGQQSEKSLNNTKLIAEIRSLMKKESIDVLLVPTDDPHMSEYTAAYYNRREFVSGFTGSAGVVIIAMNQSYLFTDGRYHRQAELELPLETKQWTLMKQGIKNVPTPVDFLSSSLPTGGRIGVDPFVHSVQSIKKYEEKLVEKKNITFKFLDHNIIDVLWGKQRPSKPIAPIRIHPLEYAGRSTQDKLKDIRLLLKESNADGLIISALDEIMWLYNIRGGDVPFNPVSISYAVVTADMAYLFIDREKVPPAVEQYLADNKIVLLPYEDILPFLRDLSAPNKKIWYDANTLNMAVYNVLHKDSRFEKTSPIILMKACKNDFELAGMRAAHLRDGAAVAEFLAWLEEWLGNGMTITEFEIDIELTKSRASYDLFLEPSFATIAGVNENAAIIHYRATDKECKTLTKDDLLLLDSGGQYLDGTTDVTRTFHFGTPTPRQSEIYTRVLKGHMGIDRQIFPTGTPGCLLDSFAREHLWQVGLNFIHGTGHGVGAALNVHEGPHRISPLLDTQGLQAGMIVSNEPGFYEVGGFGIRIENLLIVKDKKEFPEFAGKSFLQFERLTHIPIQTKMIDKTLLTKEEVTWLNDYHHQVYEKILPLLKTDRARQWLSKATQPI